MARVTRRALVAAALATVGAGVLARKFLGEPGATVGGPTDAPVRSELELRPLSDVVAIRPAAELPPLALRTLDGAPASLADHGGRPTVLNFWATWCTPCVAELPELDRLAASGAVRVLVVSADRGGAAVVRPFVAAHGVSHATVLLDQGSDAVHALQVAGFPTTFLIGADGKVHGRVEGPAAWGSAGEKIKEAVLF